MATFGQYNSVKEQFETVVLDVHDWLSSNLMEPLPSRHYSTVADVEQEIQQNILFEGDMPPIVKSVLQSLFAVKTLKLHQLNAFT